MRRMLLLLFSFSLTLQVFSQQDSVLAHFKYRVDHYRAINLSASGGSNYERIKLPPGNSTGSNYGGSAFIGIYTLKSNDKQLLQTMGAVGTSMQYNHSKNTAAEGRQQFLVAAAEYSILNKWFSRGNFVELGAGLKGQHNFSKTTGKNTGDQYRDKRTDYDLVLQAGIGKGRLENITDMQNALWLIQSLESNGRLSRQLSAVEKTELGQTISRAYGTRVPDLRKRIQYVLTATDNYLQQKGLISKTDMVYFSNLNDILFFAINDPRLSGREKFVRMSGTFSGLTQHSENITLSQNEDQDPLVKSALLSAGINIHKPVTLNRQANYGVAAKLEYLDYTSKHKFYTLGVLTGELNQAVTVKQAGLNLFYGQNFYPGTRTLIKTLLSTEGGYQHRGNESVFYGTAGITAAFNYFISYRTRFIANIGAEYNHNIYNTRQTLELLPDNILFNFNTGIEINL